MEYRDEHRIFLQGLMNRGIMTNSEVRNLFDISHQSCGVFVEENYFKNSFASFIQAINSKLDFMNLCIVKVYDEDSMHKTSSFLVLVNRLDRSNDPSMLTKKSMVSFDVHEREYLKLIMEAILVQNNKAIDNIAAINLAKEVKSKTVRNNEAEKILKKFVENGSWLKKTGQGSLKMSPRFLAEMEPYLKENYGDLVSTCYACKKMVVQSLNCSPCGSNYHLYCIGSRIPKEGGNPRCPNCKIEISLKIPGNGKRKKIQEPAYDSSSDE